MQSDEIDQPGINYLSSWINVKEVNQDSIVLPKGTFL